MIFLVCKEKESNMKLCIVKPDKTITEVSVSTKQPSLESVNNELLFFENYLYKIIIQDSETTETMELFVGDYSVSLHYNSLTDCFETETELIFGGCFDLAYLSIFLEDRNGKEKVFYTDFLRVATTKQTLDQVEGMLSEIEENLPNFLEVCFSKSRKNSGLIKNDIRSIWNTLSLTDEIIGIYEENYEHFVNHKKAVVESIAAVVDVKSVRKIEQESLRWIVNNPDYLVGTEKNSGIELNGKKYIPSKIKTYLPHYSYNIYENRAILGFLRSVLEYMSRQISELEKEIKNFKIIPQSIVMQLPNTHDLTGRCVYIYYKGVINRFLERRFRLQEIYYKYEKTLECRPDTVYSIPKLTNTFKQIYHYRLCYECMVKWFKLGDYSFDHINYLFKLKTLSRIFEYFCLIKFQMALIECGYKLQEASRVEYDTEEYAEDINNKYVFDGNGSKLVLLYEPHIWVNKVNAETNLYSTGYNFLKCKWNDKWTPDFILKISNNEKDYYFILDAKYSNANNVRKRYIPELVLKYSTQIASVGKFFSDVIGVGAVYPGDEDKIGYFKKNVVNSPKESLPVFFSVTVVGGNEGTIMFKKRILELLKIVETIEQEREPLENREEKLKQISTEDYNNQYFIFAKDNIITVIKEKAQESTQIKPVKEVEEHSIHDIAIVNDKKEEPSSTLGSVKVTGKKCFFYAKGLCMCKKGNCVIVNGSCDMYVSKISRELMQEGTCRNFKLLTTKGKSKRFECSVSGLSGCVGMNNCKFYLKRAASTKS